MADSSSANKNLAVRFGTAIVGVPLILALLFYGPSWGFYVLVLPATLIGAWELFNMTHPGDRPSQIFGVVLTALASIVTYLHGTEPKPLMTMMVIGGLIGPLWTLVRLGDLKFTFLPPDPDEG